MIIVAVIAALLAKLWVGNYNRILMAPIFPREGTIIVSTARGSGRNISLRLADAGFHVIVGVESTAEAKSFKYTTSKGYWNGCNAFFCKLFAIGVEPVILDLTKPADIAQMSYKLNAVNVRNDRSLVGMVLIGDILQVGDRKEEDRLNVKEVDTTYHRHFQGQLRLLEVCYTPIWQLIINYNSNWHRMDGRPRQRHSMSPQAGWSW